MGVKNLMTIIKRYSPNSIKYTTIDNYKNKILGIDANLMIYKMVFAIRRNGYDIMKNKIKVTHIHALLDKLIAFKKYNITPIFVFDGYFPKIKEDTMQKRKEFQKTTKKKYEKAIKVSDQDEQKKYYYMASNITSKELEECKTLISLFGYRWLNAIGEADSQLAYMSKQKMIDAIVTDDMDILVFGGTPILKNFSVSTQKKIQEINLNKLLKDLKITQKQLIYIAMIIGCDYCKDLKGVGPINAVKLVKDGVSLKGIPLNKQVFEYFNNPEVIDKIMLELPEISRKKYVDYIGIKRLLLKKGYNKEKILTIFERIKK